MEFLFSKEDVLKIVQDFAKEVYNLDIELKPFYSGYGDDIEFEGLKGEGELVGKD